MRVGSLFSGIGGLDLGLECAGMAVGWQVENDPWCQKILAKHWPDIARYGDIHEIDPNQLEPVDLICGGFPCQPVSLAGARKGQDDDRWLWPEYFRIVRHLRPRYVLVENVPGLASAGLGDVLGDLASIGYDAEWQSVPAAAVGAPHLRWRIFIVAYLNGERRWPEPVGVTGSTDTSELGDDGTQEPVAYPVGEGELQSEGRISQEWRRPGDSSQTVADTDGGRCRQRDAGLWQLPVFDPQRPPIDAGFWTVEPGMGRLVDGISRRVARLRGLGNAVVPQVAEWVGRQIMAAS